MSLAIPSIAGPSRLSARLYRPCTSIYPSLSSSNGNTSPSVARRSVLSYSTTPVRLQSRRQAYTLAQPINTPSGFEGVPAPAYVNPVDPATSTTANTGLSGSSSGKGKEKAQIVEGHGAPPPAPSEVKPRRKIQAKKAAISMTPTAVERLRALMSTPNPQLLRIGVKTRGCAGMAYHLEYVSPPGGKFDEVVEQDGVRVLIDSKALFSIIGSRMDWRDTRLSAGFVFDNPNVVDSCGCGESFNIRF